MAGHRRAVGSWLAAIASVATLSHAQTPPSCDGTGPASTVQPVDSFDWPLASGSYRHYSRLAAARGAMGGGSAYLVTIEGGALHLAADPGSWAGAWFSLAGDAAENRILDLDSALPGWVLGTLQVTVTSWSLRVKGQGTLKIELKDAQDQVLQSWIEPVDNPDFVLLARPFASGLGAAKLFNLVAEGGSDLAVDEVAFSSAVPVLTPLRYAFVGSYAQLLRGLDEASGLVRDHAQFPSGDFDSVPAMGLVALGLAMAADLGVVAQPDATAQASHVIDVLLALPAEPQTGWLPHWLHNGGVHPSSEYSTVDTAIAYLASIQSANILGLSTRREALRAKIDALDFAAVTSAQGQISHGITQAGGVIPFYWDGWGGETALVEILRAYRDPTLPLLNTTRTPPAYCGRGFIVELGALFFEALGAATAGSDRWGVNWADERRQHLLAQLGAAGNAAIFGASPVEIVSDGGETRYLEAGVGTPTCEAVQGDGVYGSPWWAPHYMAMSASLDLDRGCSSAAELRARGLMPPLAGPAESILTSASGSTERWHSVQTSWNAALNALGYYHALVRAEGRPDAVYAVPASDARLRAALGVLADLIFRDGFQGGGASAAPPGRRRRAG